jgi:hypothetical protein
MLLQTSPKCRKNWNYMTKRKHRKIADFKRKIEFVTPLTENWRWNTEVCVPKTEENLERETQHRSILYIVWWSVLLLRSPEVVKNKYFHATDKISHMDLKPVRLFALYHWKKNTAQNLSAERVTSKYFWLLQILTFYRRMVAICTCRFNIK